MRVPGLSFLAIAVLLPYSVAAQSVPVAQVGKPEAELSDPFDQVTAVRELSDGRLVVADLFARTVSLVDLGKNSATAIGRQGQGPNEFAFPAGLVPLPHDTTWLVDLAQRRFLVITPAGAPAGSVSFPDGFAGLARIKGADAEGRIYAQGSPFGGDGPPPDPSALPDSAPILRWDRGSKAISPLGKVKLPTTSMAASGTAGNRNVMMRQQPLSSADDWAVTPAGRVGFVRVGQYHVDWGAPAARRGPAVDYTPVKVSERDKKEWEARMNDRRGAITIERGGPPPSGETPPPQPKLPPVDWPEAKPPFVANTALASPEGEIWVERSQPAGDPPLIDVFDPAGKLSRQVRLPAGSRLVAVGIKGLYVARADEDGLWYLGRYKKP